MKAKVLFVSSYDESCGNAYFTKALVDSMKNMCDAECLQIRLELTQSRIKRVRKMADEHISGLCEKLKTADYVNLQIEPVLYGLKEGDIVRRIVKLMTANANTTITMHNTRILPGRMNVNVRGIIKDILLFRPIKAARKVMFLNAIYGNMRVNRRIIKAAKKHNIYVIVHTERARRQILAVFGYDKVIVHPLKFCSSDSDTKRSGIETLSTIKKALKIDNSARIIGMFGYISHYKGHHDAIRALGILGNEYYCFFFGRQHPQTIYQYGEMDEYINKLLNLVKEEKLEERVVFLGEWPEKEFVGLMGAVDICWLPYYEVGQDGSGIAAQVFEESSRVVCSASSAFDELLAMETRSNVWRCDIGNYAELAAKTRLALGSSSQSRTGSVKSYTVSSQVKAYCEAWGLNVDVKQDTVSRQWAHHHQ